ncbi:MAG: DUF123 domain-containing protein [Crenarchaeota archaeon]|nr:DUF123 domain-containing protein [Thermoproteota archaeon]
MYNLFIRRNSVKGVYLLIIEIIKPLTIMIKKRNYELKKTHLIYVGSAHGPGGLSARISRHLKTNKKVHWHIDQVTSSKHAMIKAVCLLPMAPRNYESIISSRLADALEYVPGFGSTDKPEDKSHLFICGSMDKCMETVKAVENRIKYPIITIIINH